MDGRASQWGLRALIALGLAVAACGRSPLWLSTRTDAATLVADAGREGVGGGNGEPAGCGPAAIGRTPWLELPAPPLAAGYVVCDAFTAAPDDIFFAASTAPDSVGQSDAVWRWTGANGGTWTVEQQKLDGASAPSLSGTAADDVWFAAGSLLLHRGTSGWSSADGGWHTAVQYGPGGLNGVRAWSRDNVWLIADLGIVHWTAGTWSGFRFAALPPEPHAGDLAFRFSKLWPAGPNDVWVGGRTDEIGTTMPDVYLAHYDGEQLTSATSLGKSPLASITGDGNGGFWFTTPGFYEYGDGGEVSVQVRHYRQAAFGEVSIESWPRDGYHEGLNAIWAPARDDAWAAGAHDPDVVMAHWDGRCWRAVTNVPDVASRTAFVVGDTSWVWVVTDGPRFFRMPRR